MKKIILLLALTFIFSWCEKQKTFEENKAKIKECEELWVWYYLGSHWIKCDLYRIDKVQDCIQMYVNSIQEKYRNPDVISDLREEDYSKVVETCQKTFWKNNK